MNFKKALTVILAFIMLVTMAVPSFAMSEAQWADVWATDDAKAGIIMFVGSDESQRNFSWYTKTENVPEVIISEDTAFADAVSFKGTAVKASEGDFANKVTVSGLKADTTYYYQCVSGDFISDVYSFTTADASSFSAMYVTDIHISDNSEENPDNLSNTSYLFSETYEDALSKNSDISVILSAGDQASEGLEAEYKALTASPLFKTVSFATSIGNHDRKGVEYRTFTNLPNQDTQSSITSYIGKNYWFVKGDVLFLMMDSNNANAEGHVDFIEAAISANPDVKWKVMMMHHDLYSGRIPHRESENGLLRMIWGPIADEYGIDLVLLGHSHYYTVTNVLYGNRNIELLDPLMRDPAGTIYMVSCSITRPRGDDDELGLNKQVGFDYLTENATYNILDCSEDSITVKSYEVGADEPFNSFTITKTSAQGGHKTETGYFQTMWNKLVRKISSIYALFNNIGVYSDLKADGFDVNLFDVITGK